MGRSQQSAQRHYLSEERETKSIQRSLTRLSEALRAHSTTLERPGIVYGLAAAVARSPGYLLMQYVRNARSSLQR